MYYLQAGYNILCVCIEGYVCLLPSHIRALTTCLLYSEAFGKYFRSSKFYVPKCIWRVMILII
jgi:hypothetical protein